MGDTIQRSDILESFVLVEDFAVLHEMVKAQIYEGFGSYEFAIIHTVGGITTTRRRKLRDFPGGGKEEREQWHLCEYPKCPTKFNKIALYPFILEGHRQRMGFVEHNEDIR